VDHIEFCTGGGGTNTAFSLAHLGLKSAFLGKIGSDEAGEKLLQELQEAGVDTSFHIVSKRRSTGYSVILTSFEGDRTVLVHRGANSVMDADDIDWSFLDKTRWVHITSLSGRSAKLLPVLVQRAKRKGVKISLNPGSTQIRQGLKGLKNILSKVEVLFLNKEEAAALTGRSFTRTFIDQERCTLCGECVEVCPEGIFVMQDKKIKVTGEERCTRCGKCLSRCPTRAIVTEPWAFNLLEIFETILKAGPGIVVITDGPNGAQAADGKSHYLFPPYDVPVIATLGAGDAFSSAFVAAIIKKKKVKEALELATANASCVIQKFGAKVGLLTMEEAEAFVQENRDEEHTVREIPFPSKRTKRKRKAKGKRPGVKKK
jgi:sugar/nucleoside kinase (ribokinase family)